MSERFDEERASDPVAASAPARERDALVRHEEELRVEKGVRESGSLRARKRVESHRVEELVARGVEDADIERTGPHENDSGEIETLPDGSISVPVFEEEVIVTKRMLVRERVIIQKEALTERRAVETELLKERVEADAETDATGKPRF